jgi:hypothetical protein
VSDSAPASFTLHPPDDNQATWHNNFIELVSLSAKRIEVKSPLSSEAIIPSIINSHHTARKKQKKLQTGRIKGDERSTILTVFAKLLWKG